MGKNVNSVHTTRGNTGGDLVRYIIGLGIGHTGGHPALSDVTPCLLSDFFENSGGTPHPPLISYRIAPSDFESQILHPPPHFCTFGTFPIV